MVRYSLIDAAIDGNLEPIKWAYQNGIEVPGYINAYAAEYDHIDILDFLKEIGCEWNNVIIYKSIVDNKIGILEWAHKNNCCHHPNFKLFMRKYAKSELIEWALEKGYY